MVTRVDEKAIERVAGRTSPNLIVASIDRSKNYEAVVGPDGVVRLPLALLSRCDARDVESEIQSMENAVPHLRVDDYIAPGGLPIYTAVLLVGQASHFGSMCLNRWNSWPECIRVNELAGRSLEILHGEIPESGTELLHVRDEPPWKYENLAGIGLRLQSETTRIPYIKRGLDCWGEDVEPGWRWCGKGAGPHIGLIVLDLVAFGSCRLVYFHPASQETRAIEFRLS